MKKRFVLKEMAFEAIVEGINTLDELRGHALPGWLAVAAKVNLHALRLAHQHFASALSDLEDVYRRVDPRGNPVPLTRPVEPDPDRYRGAWLPGITYEAGQQVLHGDDLGPALFEADRTTFGSTPGDASSPWQEIGRVLLRDGSPVGYLVTDGPAFTAAREAIMRVPLSVRILALPLDAVMGVETLPLSGIWAPMIDYDDDDAVPDAAPDVEPEGAVMST